VLSCASETRLPARICLLDRLATLKWGVMPVTVGRAQVMAVLNACREAVAAQYAQRARGVVMKTGQRPALAARGLCEHLNHVLYVLSCVSCSFDRLCC